MSFEIKKSAHIFWISKFLEALLLSMIKNYELLKVRKEPIWGWGHFGAGPFWDWDQFRTRANLGLGPMWDGANLGLIWGQCGMGPIWVLGQCGLGQYGPGQCGPGQYVLGQFGRIPTYMECFEKKIG